LSSRILLVFKDWGMKRCLAHRFILNTQKTSKWQSPKGSENRD